MFYCIDKVVTLNRKEMTILEEYNWQEKIFDIEGQWKGKVAKEQGSLSFSFYDF